jgi:putative membrane protein
MFLSLLAATPVWAHSGGDHVTPENFWQSWVFELPIVAGLLLFGGWYTWGVYRLWHKAGAGHGVLKRQVAAFSAAMLALAAALISPIDPLGETLFSAHMVQHLLLTLIAAPLLVLSGIPVACLHVLPTGWPQKAGRFLASIQRPDHWMANPLLMAAVYAVAFWAWHVPSLYQAALENDTVHAIEHLSFIGAAIPFWWTILQPHRSRSNSGVAILAIFFTVLHSGILGALLTFSTALWYPAYADGTAAWGLTPLQDQQLAGAIMWVPGGILFTILAAVLFGRWIDKVEPSTRSGPPKSVRDPGQPVEISDK